MGGLREQFFLNVLLRGGDKKMKDRGRCGTCYDEQMDVGGGENKITGLSETGRE